MKFINSIVATSETNFSLARNPLKSQREQPANLTNTLLPKSQVKQKTDLFKRLLDWSRESMVGNVALSFFGLAGLFVDAVAKSLGLAPPLIEELMNRRLFQPELEVKIPQKKAELVTIPSKDGHPELHGYFFLKKNSELGVIYLHGYNGSMFNCHPEAFKISEELNVNVALFDYRGFGINQGKPTIDGVVKDVERMYNYMVNKRSILPKNIIIYTSSLGGAIALETYVTKLKPKGKKIGAMVLLYPFSSVRDIAKIAERLEREGMQSKQEKQMKPSVIPPFMIPNKRLNSKKLIRELDVPLHIAHGMDDKRTPFEHSKAIFDNARSLREDQKELYPISELGHDDLTDEKIASLPSVQGYFKSLREFFMRHFPEHKL